MPASIPIRHGGTFASRDTTLARATFSRSTISPRASRPTRCIVFLPGSIPMVTIAVPTLRGMACLLVLVTPQAYSLVVGPERGRSIPFSEVTTPVIEVGLVGHSGPDLLTLSFSHFDPYATWPEWCSRTCCRCVMICSQAGGG